MISKKVPNVRGDARVSHHGCDIGDSLPDRLHGPCKGGVYLDKRRPYERLGSAIGSNGPVVSKQGTVSALSCLHGPGILEVLQIQGIRIQADPYSSKPDPQHRTCGKQARHSIGITLSTRPCNVGGATNTRDPDPS